VIQRWCRERGHCIWQSFLHCMSPLKNIWANLLNLYVLDAKNTSLFLLYNILNLIEKHMWAPWLPLTISPKGSNGSKGPNSQKGKKKRDKPGKVLHAMGLKYLFYSLAICIAIFIFVQKTRNTLSNLTHLYEASLNPQCSFQQKLPLNSQFTKLVLWCGPPSSQSKL
jgi:hypothetical protein